MPDPRTAQTNIAASTAAEAAAVPLEEKPGALFAAYLQRTRPQIDDYLARTAAACAPGTPEATAADLDRFLYAPLARFTTSGGKRTRPALCLLGCEAVGGEAARAMSAAAAIEVFQSAALIHDDIADESELRRGEPCTYVTEGTGVAINIGDLGLTDVLGYVLRDQGLPADVRLAVMEKLLQMEERTIEGQAAAGISCRRTTSTWRPTRPPTIRRQSRWWRAQSWAAARPSSSPRSTASAWRPASPSSCRTTS